MYNDTHRKALVAATLLVVGCECSTYPDFDAWATLDEVEATIGMDAVRDAFERVATLLGCSDPKVEAETLIEILHEGQDT